MGTRSSAPGQLISLPQGGGALQGLGETFSPDLFTGTGNFTLPLTIPAGRNGLQPTVSLLYSTGAGNGPFGLGWGLSIPQVSRKTAKGVPIYDDSRDVFLLSQSEDLVPVSEDEESATYRPRTEADFARIAHYKSPSHNYWQVRSTDGMIHEYGTSGKAESTSPVLADPADSRRIFTWNLATSSDPFGNRVVYDYEIEKSQDERRPWQQIYLSAIRYIDYGDQSDLQYLVTVLFHYEERPDAFSDRRAGFEIRTTRRCQKIEVWIDTGQQNLIRRYTFHYEQAPFNGNTLLTEVSTTGYAGEQSDEQSEHMPPLQFHYSEFAPGKQTFLSLTGKDSPSGSLAHPDYELADIDGNGLPDFLSLDGNAQYWRNLGAGRLDTRRPLPVIPAGIRLQDPGAQLIDADGDGQIDLMVFNDRFGGYYPLTAKPSEGQLFYQPYRLTPSIDLKDPEVRLVDLTGDGVTDAIHSGTSMEYFFNDPLQGWYNIRAVPRRALDDFPNVNFSDPRVHLACMTGDNLQDIVFISNGRVEYWPSLGHGNWGARILMENSPRFPSGYHPQHVLLGDVDGDGVADLVYVDDQNVSLWMNQNGNRWSEEISISGTPSIADANAIRLTDILGNGVSGILWSFPAQGTKPTMYFLDFIGGVKPYLLSRIVNNAGAETHIEYAPSTRYYLADEQTRSRRWQTSLPFPVQVVSRVKSTDHLTGNSLTTEYFYHHGYWDGVEREFHGFGRVDHRDTLRQKDLEPSQHYSPPTETRTWFHLGSISDRFAGHPFSADFTREYWSEDPSVFPVFSPPEGWTSREQRDALRALCGHILRTELYALDESECATRPYQVSEQSYDVRMEVKGTASLHGVFFPYACAERMTNWERGNDPHTTATFLDDYDAYGQARKTSSIAVPRGRDHRISGKSNEPYLATLSTVQYAPPPDQEHFIADRVTSEAEYDIQNDGTTTLLELHEQIIDGRATGEVFSHILHFYDGEAFVGLPSGEIGHYGALVRTEELVLTEELLREAYQSGQGSAIPPYLVHEGPPPWTSEYPAEFQEKIPALAGYHYQTYQTGSSVFSGYYAAAQRYRYDFQEGAGQPRGMLKASLDPLGNQVTVEYDSFPLLPCIITDAVGLVITASYNYRTMLPHESIDFNGNRIRYIYTPLGHVASMAVMGKEGQEGGDTPQTPSIRWVYDFLAFVEHGQPLSIRTIQREYHSTDISIPLPLRDQTIERVEYSDGFGRLLQTRTQGEEIRFGDPIFGTNVLPADQSQPGGTTIGNAPEPGAPARTIISGWQIYDNKGRVVEKYEPFFAQGWDYTPPTEQENGQRIRFAYDPPGRLILTIYPDGSEERTIYGVPVDLTNPDVYTPAPWETYVYDANDNAGRTDPVGSLSYEAHWNTPTSSNMDALGRVVQIVTRNGRQPENWYNTLATYDIRGNLLTLVDQLGRLAFSHTYDLANRPWRVEQLDSGIKRQVLDASSNVVELRDSREALELLIYDRLQRRRQLWARDQENLPVTSREYLIYGDSPDSGLPPQEAANRNLLGALYTYSDEAGLLTCEMYDFKGNLSEKSRQVISDAALLDRSSDRRFPSPANTVLLLEPESYLCSFTYDALNRVKTFLYPQDVTGERKEFRPLYNRAGALQSVEFAGEIYVENIAYDARGQRTLIAYGNGIMTRYAYDEHTFRLMRMRSEGYTIPAPHTYRPTGAGPLQDYGYEYDLVGNILDLHDRTPGDGVPEQPDQLDRAFRYDPLYRLIAASGRECNLILPDPWSDAPRCQDQNGTHLYSEEYSYDPTDNLKRLQHLAEGNAFTRELDLRQGTNRLAALRVGNTTIPYDYDASGNLTGEATSRRFTWDHRNCMIHFTTQQEDDQPPVLSCVYSYDGAGQRVKQVIQSQTDPQKVTITIDGIFEVQRLGSGPEMRENNMLHILETAQRIALIRVGPPLPDDPAPAVQYQLPDHLGSSNVVVDQDGTWLNREEYTPFGETSFGSFVHKCFRYSGKERDDGSGLYYYGARYLSPWLARWISPDPSGPTDGLNLYAFARNNPLTFVDPNGNVIEVATKTEGRVTTHTIKMTARLIDETRSYSEGELQTLTAKLRESFKKAFAFENSLFKKNVTLRYQSELTLSVGGEPARNEHIVRIVDALPPGHSSDAVGSAPIGHKAIYVLSSFIQGKLNQPEPYISITHEFGHTMGLEHVPTGTAYEGNLMHPALNLSSLQVGEEQLDIIREKYERGQLNLPAQTYKEYEEYNKPKQPARRSPSPDRRRSGYSDRRRADYSPRRRSGYSDRRRSPSPQRGNKRPRTDQSSQPNKRPR